MDFQSAASSRQASAGFSLVEVLTAMGLLGIMITGLVAGFMQTHRVAEFSAHALAAQSLANQPLEQARAAKWDPYASPPVDQLVASNFPVVTNILDIPINGTNIVVATNRTTIRVISTDPPLKEIAAETTWRFLNRGIITNRALTYRAPDQ
jgi:prepilin-type N-terminal cleavage/methylation domain-containing protein